MATAYSSLYEQLPQKPSVFSPKGVMARIASIGYNARFRYAMPIGQTNGDIIYLGSIFANVVAANPQISGLYLKRFVLTCSANAGGAVTFNLGTAATPTLLGSALTTLQSATTLDVPVATVSAAPLFIVNDDFRMVLTANTTTTAVVLTGWYDLSYQAP